MERLGKQPPVFEKDPSCEHISPTAKFVAFMQTFSGDPLWQKMAEASDSEEVARRMLEELGSNLEHDPEINFVIPLAEARYRATTQAIMNLMEQKKINQVLGVATGLNPRGLALTQMKDKFPNLIFTESDLPEVIKEKEAIYRSIFQGNIPANLHFRAVDALNPWQFTNAVVDFHRNEPIVIENEGMMPYFNREENTKYARSNHNILSQLGGFWVTPDIMSRDRLEIIMSQGEKMARIIEIITGVSKRDVLSNAFTNEEDARKFFEENGFQHEQITLSKLLKPEELVSGKNIGINPAVISKLMETMQIWVMMPK